MLASQLRRYIHSGMVHLATAEKALLAKLRKKTGYPLSNCKKALQMHNSDIKEAEAWLHAQAQAHGWEKATKLQGRATAQGLVGIMVKNGIATMVEVNCETDFAARNKKFQSLVQNIVQHCFEFTQKQSLVGPLQKGYLTQKQLNVLPTSDDKTLADLVALSIGQIGENMSLRRAVCVRAEEEVFLSGCVHPATSSDAFLFGKFGSLVVFRKTPTQAENVTKDVMIQEFGRQLCQHVIGMDPSVIGDPDNNEPASNPEEETVLIHQEFLLDASVTVGELLQEAGITLLDFIRFECGEQQTEE